MDSDTAAVVREGIALSIGIVWAVGSGYLIAAVAKRRGIALDRPVAVTLLSYTFACVAYGLIWFVVALMIAFQAFVLFGIYCVPLLALICDAVLLRNTTNASGIGPISLAVTGRLVLSTQGILLALVVSAVWLARTV